MDSKLTLPFSSTRVSRRTILVGAGAATRARAQSSAIPEDLKTPHKLDRLVVAPTGREGDFDSKGVDCPFVYFHGGLFWMTYVGFDGTGYQTGLASSTDLVRWRKEGLLLGRDASNPVTRHNVALTWILRENEVFSVGRLKKVSDRYLGTYHAYPSAGYEAGPAVIGLAWSEDQRKWRLDPPCLTCEDGADWERGGLYKSCLVEHEGTYYMFYNAKNQATPWREQIGVATSGDLKTWVRHQGNPILANGPAGSVDEIFASDPCVLRHGGGWAVFYYSLDKRGAARDLLAMSADLKSAAKCDGILVDTGRPGSVDSQYAHKPSIVWRDGVLYHFYCAVSKEHGRGIAVAASQPWPKS